MNSVSHYDALQVSRHASASVIRAAYKALSQTQHPDKNPNDLEAAHKNMKRLNEAYAVLSDLATKAAYDRQLDAFAAQSSTHGAQSKPSSASPSRPPPPPPPRPSPPSPPPPSPPAPQAGRSNSNGLPVGLTTCVAIAAIVAFVVYRSSSTGTLATGGLAVVPAAGPRISAPALTLPTLAVAAINAHVRKEPSAKSKAIALLSRETAIEPIEIVNGFVKFRLSSGGEGWISRDVVIARTNAIRLSGLSAVDYASARAPLRGVERLFAALEPYRELQVQALFQLATESAQLDATLDELANRVRIALDDVDADAVSWYSLEAKYYVDRDRRAEGLQSARAAVLADPANVDGHVALAYAALRAGEFGIADGVATVLPSLAPNSTNTWVIVGVSAASNDNSVLASNAFALALRKSRNTKVTVQVLANLAAQTADAKVSRAIGTVLEHWSQK